LERLIYILIQILILFVITKGVDIDEVEGTYKIHDLNESDLDFEVEFY